MLPESSWIAVVANGLSTCMPVSFTNEVVMMKKISRFITKSSIGARSMPVSSDSGACCCAISPALPRGAERDVLDAPQPDLVEHLHEQSRRDGLVGHHHHPVVRLHRVHALDVRAHRAHGDHGG